MRDKVLQILVVVTVLSGLIALAPLGPWFSIVAIPVTFMGMVSLFLVYRAYWPALVEWDGLVVRRLTLATLLLIEFAYTVTLYDPDNPPYWPGFIAFFGVILALRLIKSVLSLRIYKK